MYYNHIEASYAVLLILKKKQKKLLTATFDSTDGASNDILEELKNKPLREVLSDAGTFAYVSLCAISMSLLYEDKWHR